jgi:hypothetical protein
MAKVALVGVGAVGQVYAHHLKRAGDELVFFLKPKYVAVAESGFLLHPVNGDRTPVTLKASQIVTSPEELAQAGVDELWLCMSSTALKGDWLAPLLEAAGSAQVITLQPGLEDREHLLQFVPEERLVTGLISFMSWQAPLPGEQVAPGVRFWHPWTMKSVFSGPGADDIVRRLRAGGCPAKVGDARVEMALGSAMLQPIVGHLECVDWKMGRLSERGAEVAACQEQVMAIAAGFLGVSTRMTPPGFLISMAGTVVPAVVPVDIEAFFEWHFTKVGDQTRAMLGTWIAEGQARGLPVDRIQALASELGT